MAETLRLDAIQPGHSAQVVALKGDSTRNKRMTEMGLTKGALVQVERVAPLGDPMDLKVRGYRLSLRKDEASQIEVVQVPPFSLPSGLTTKTMFGQANGEA